MSINLPDHYVITFDTSMELLLQQTASALRDCVMQGSYTGKAASVVDQYGAIEMQPVTGRLEPKVRSDAPVDRRWIYPLDRDLTQYVDTFDKLRLMTDPTSQFVQVSAAAVGRDYDRIIIDAFFGDARTGEQGGTTVSFGTTLTTSAGGRNVSVSTGGTASGLNVAKLREGKKILMARQVDIRTDPIYLGVTATQHDNLLNEVQITSAEFNGGDRPVLKEGEIERFLGINFKRCELFETGTDDAAGTSRALPMWAKSGMKLGTWMSPSTTVTQDFGIKGNPYQIYTMMTIGATRTQEDKVLRVWCRE
jgi:hypothetical protein